MRLPEFLTELSPVRETLAALEQGHMMSMEPANLERHKREQH